MRVRRKALRAVRRHCEALAAHGRSGEGSGFGVVLNGRRRPMRVDAREALQSLLPLPPTGSSAHNGPSITRKRAAQQYLSKHDCAPRVQSPVNAVVMAHGAALFFKCRATRQVLTLPN